jgi:lysine-N-methylase
LRDSPQIRPAYADHFRCIGSACEDTCCRGWSVPIDRATYEKYQSVPASALRTLILEHIDENAGRLPLGAAGGNEAASVFAKIRMTSANQCPLLNEARLCRIQAELGEGLLSHACATYPRIVHAAGSEEEKALTLSCPEAARLVLLTPNLLDPTPPTPSGLVGVDESTEVGEDGADSQPPYFWPIRQVVLALLQNRAYPLWQRLFLLGVLCRRLDSISRGELHRSIPEFLQDFSATVATGALRTAMETLPVDRAAQLDVVLRLAGLLLHRSNVRPRFVECVQAFTLGIGNGPGATLESLTSQYSQAHDCFYKPFFRRHPYILENYLINTVIRTQFPFGREGMRAGGQPCMDREFALLTAQFALMKGLLIGVAGFHAQSFKAEHVVHTVQAAAKHFEHHPEFLKMAHELLMESRMDGARGQSILLRNAAVAELSSVPRPASPKNDVALIAIAGA